MRMLLVMVIGLWSTTVARADVVGFGPEPQCDPGFVVQWTHGGAACVRPSCRVDADCPSGLGLVCPPGHCFKLAEDRPCLDALGRGARTGGDERARNAFEPPPPCPPLRQNVQGSCENQDDCTDGAYCSARTCQPGSTTEMGPPQIAPTEMTSGSMTAAMTTSEMASTTEMAGSGTTGEVHDQPRNITDGGCTTTPAGSGALIVMLWFLWHRRDAKTPA